MKFSIRERLLVCLVLIAFVGWGVDHYRMVAATGALNRERENLHERLGKVIEERQALFYALNEHGLEAESTGPNKFEIRELRSFKMPRSDQHSSPER